MLCLVRQRDFASTASPADNDISPDNVMMKVNSSPDSRVSLKFYLIDFGLSSSFSSASSASPPRTAPKRTIAFRAGNPALFESAFGKGDEDEDDDEDFETPETKKSNTVTIKYGFLPFFHLSRLLIQVSFLPLRTLLYLTSIQIAPRSRLQWDSGFRLSQRDEVDDARAY